MQVSSIYDVHKKIRIFDPSPCPHASTWAWCPSPLWTSTCRRHEIHITLSKQLLPSGPKAKIRLWYHCNLFEPILLVVYIASLYCLKISTFYSIRRRNSGPKYANFFAWEGNRMTSVGSNFVCGCPSSAWLHPLSADVHLSKTLPLYVDVINEWPVGLHAKIIEEAHGI